MDFGPAVYPGSWPGLGRVRGWIRSGGAGVVGSWIRGFVGAVRGFVDSWIRGDSSVREWVHGWVRGFVGS